MAPTGRAAPGSPADRRHRRSGGPHPPGDPRRGVIHRVDPTLAQAAGARLGRGVNDTATLEYDGHQVAITTLWPTPRLVIVGDGLLADALGSQAALLGWRTSVTPDVGPATAAVAGLHPCDGVIVLTHDRAVDGPILAAALASQAGYIGALGSRRTQSARAGWLTEHGLDEHQIRRVRGPAGLDIGSRTPAEIAMAIAAEMLSIRTGAETGALRDRTGPVHAEGLGAPPQRYAAGHPGRPNREERMRQPR